jgi:hypothetical protein
MEDNYVVGEQFGEKVELFYGTPIIDTVSLETAKKLKREGTNKKIYRLVEVE